MQKRTRSNNSLAMILQIYNLSHSSSPAQPPEGSASLWNLGMTSMLHTDVKG